MSKKDLIKNKGLTDLQYRAWLEAKIKNCQDGGCSEYPCCLILLYISVLDNQNN